MRINYSRGLVCSRSWVCIKECQTQKRYVQIEVSCVGCSFWFGKCIQKRTQGTKHASMQTHSLVNLLQCRHARPSRVPTSPLSYSIFNGTCTRKYRLRLPTLEMFQFWPMPATGGHGKLIQQKRKTVSCTCYDASEVRVPYSCVQKETEKQNSRHNLTTQNATRQRSTENTKRRLCWSSYAEGTTTKPPIRPSEMLLNIIGRSRDVRHDAA